MEAFHYDNLDLGRPMFRLVRLLMGTANNIECEIFQASFDERQHAISYEALSYTWGSTENSDKIWLNGRALGVTHNLATALRHLRWKARDRILWIDALCINQQNKSEKSHQVRQMGNIYREAESVIFWLGTATHQTDFVLDALLELYAISKDTACANWSQADPAWNGLWEVAKHVQRQKHDDFETNLSDGLQDLISRPWFDRVWIIQEVANAQSGFVHCGTRAVSARIFAMAPNLIGVMPTSQCRAVLSIMPGYFRKESWWASKRDLRTLLDHFSRSKSQCAQDLVYALLDMSSDGRQSRDLYPDYDKSESEVLEATFYFLFSMDMNIDLRKTITTIEGLAINMNYAIETTIKAYIDMADGRMLANFLARYDDLTIEKTTLLAAAGQHSDVWSMLLERTRETICLDDEMFEAMSKNRKSPIDLLELFFRKTSWEFKLSWTLLASLLEEQCVWSQLMLVLRCEPSAKGVLSQLLINAVSEGRLVVMTAILREGVTVTEDVLKVAAQSTSYTAIEMINALLRERKADVVLTKDVVELAANNKQWGEELAPLLLREFKGEVMVTQKIFRAAIENWYHGDAVIKALLNEQREAYKITKEDLWHVAVRCRDQTVMALMLEAVRGEIDVTEEIIRAAVQNKSCGEAVTALLLEELKEDIEDSEAMLIAAALNMSQGAGIITLLLREGRLENAITEKVLITAARNWDQGEAVIALLLEKVSEEIEITEVELMAAANNPRQGAAVMKLLLRRLRSGSAITESVFWAAAANGAQGEEIMELLVRAGGAESNRS